VSIAFGSPNTIPANARLDTQHRPLTSVPVTSSTSPVTPNQPISFANAQTFYCTPPSGVTGNDGKWTTTLFTRHKTVSVAALNDNDSVTHNMLPATYATTFLCTVYIVADENDYGGPLDQAGAHGLAGQYKIAFLRAVMFQGSGRAADGTIITINWNVPFTNFSNIQFKIVSSPPTASGRALTTSSIAVDKTVIPLNISPTAAATVTIQPPAGVTIPGGNDKTVDDSGGRINGYHIDIFAGYGKASQPAGWNNPQCTLILTSY
jgi:3D (Asp-Asp-Asp) domain-containing protein